MLPVGTLMIINGTVTLADLVLVFCLTLSVGAPLLKALNFAGKIPQLNYKVDEIEKAMDHELLKTNNNAFTGDSYGVKYSDVRFAYKEKEVLQGGACGTIEKGLCTIRAGTFKNIKPLR